MAKILIDTVILGECHALIFALITGQDDLMVRVIFGKFVCEKQLVDFILAIRATTSFFSSFFILSCGYMSVSTYNVVLNFNIGVFFEKSPIANKSSCTV